MKLEYLASGSADCPLIRLYDFTTAEASQLRQVFAELAIQEKTSVALHELPFIEPVNDCRLILKVHSWDQGLIKVVEPTTFQCALTWQTWYNIEGLCEPFASEGAESFQWLNSAGIPLLLSPNGCW
jgi:hypothetical protein